MPAEDDRVRVNGRVPRDLYVEISSYYANITVAINDAFELLRQEKKGQLHMDCSNNMHNGADSIQAQLDAACMQIDASNMQIEFLKDQQKIKDSQQDARINDLLQQLKVKDDQIKVNDEHQNNRIEDLKNHIYLLDNQLRTKDDQIEKLNENMHKQAVHIQSLIQENSRMNAKLLPENIEKKKPFWKFW